MVGGVIKLVSMNLDLDLDSDIHYFKYQFVFGPSSYIKEYYSNSIIS